jgi:hypothetical protein
MRMNWCETICMLNLHESESIMTSKASRSLTALETGCVSSARLERMAIVSCIIIIPSDFTCLY